MRSSRTPGCGRTAGTNAAARRGNAAAHWRHGSPPAPRLRGRRQGRAPFPCVRYRTAGAPVVAPRRRAPSGRVPAAAIPAWPPPGQPPRSAACAPARPARPAASAPPMRSGRARRRRGHPPHASGRARHARRRPLPEESRWPRPRADICKIPALAARGESFARTGCRSGGAPKNAAVKRPTQSGIPCTGGATGKRISYMGLRPKPPPSPAVPRR